MKKLVLALLAVVLMSGVAFASQDINKIIDNKTFSQTGTTHELVSSAIHTGDAERVSFFVTYNPTKTGVSASVTFEASLEGVTWGRVYPEIGGVTNPIWISTTETKILSLPVNMTLPQMRIGLTVPNDTSYGSTDTARVTVTVVEQK